MMKKIFFLVALFACISAAGQTYTYIGNRYDWLAGLFRALGLPAGSGPAAFQPGQRQQAGAVYYDSAGVDAGLYIWDGLTWSLSGATDTTSLSTRIDNAFDSISAVNDTTVRFHKPNGGYHDLLLSGGIGSDNFIQNQFSTSQVAKGWVNKFMADTLIAGTAVTNPSTYSNGQMWYNSTDGKFKVVENGAIKNAVDNSVSGRTILVDKDNPNATDIRTGLSKYNQDYPFKTVAAALAVGVVVSGDNVVIQNGTYSEVINVTLPVQTTVTINNANVLSFKSTSGQLNLIGLGNSSIDTFYYYFGDVVSGLTKIKVVLNYGGTSSAVFRNIYSMDSVVCPGGTIGVEFYNINNIRTVTVGNSVKFYNCRIINKTGSGIAVRSSSSVVGHIDSVAFVECYIVGSAYAFSLNNLGTKLKIFDCEAYGATNTIFGGSGGTTRTSQVRVINSILRSTTGNNTISAGNANHTLNLELSNTTRSGGTSAIGTVNYLLQNNDIVYNGL